MAKVTDYKIIIPSAPSPNERRAAQILCENVKLICGKKLPILGDDTPAGDFEIAVGRTNREALDGFAFDRKADDKWGYEVKTVGTRLYLTGLGVYQKAPYEFSARPTFDDGLIGTVYAVYRFTEDVLGYYFLETDYHGYEEKPELEMPASYNAVYSKAFLWNDRPRKIDGAAMYVISPAVALNWNTGCFIFKTASGKLILLDGGQQSDAEHVVEVLEYLADGKKPEIEVMMLSHMHGDHYGFFVKLYDNPDLAARVTIKDFYCDIMDDEFYLHDASETNQGYVNVRHRMVDCGKLGMTMHTVKKGDHITLEEFDFEVIHVPTGEVRGHMNMNDSGVVYKLNYNNGEQTIMLLGDAEWVCSNDMINNNPPEKLKSDVVQVGHHGCGNVSEECYRRIGAKIYIWQSGIRYWYCDDGEGLNSFNVGAGRSRIYINEAGGTPENLHRADQSILSFELPIKLIEKGRA